ncbi:MAG: response regulator [Chlorobiales bacterium]|nr:response regulator [Chlorobiales bacterium]
MIRKLLLVDDDPEIHFFLHAVFENPWISIRSVHTGKQALAEFREMEYDLIITDIAMPELSGIDLIKEIEKSPFRVPPIVILSSVNDSQLIMQCLSSGVSDYIIKPADPDRIRKTAYDLLRLDDNGEPITQRTLSSYMGEITMMKISGTLLLDDGKEKGEILYENGHLKQISFGTMTGFQALDAAKNTKFLNVTFVAGSALAENK